MARPIRIAYPGALYHITTRGNGRGRIFLNDGDKEAFLKILQSIIARYSWLCYAYCLMDNHYHLFIETPNGNVSIGMRQLNGTYTQYFNRRHKKVGHVFQGRFNAVLVEKESYLMTLSAYIVLNPVRAQLVKKPGDWKWSSYKITAGKEEDSGYIERDFVLERFSQDRREAERKYEEFVCQALKEKSPWEETVGQVLLGGEKFIEKMRVFLREKEAVREIPKLQRYAGRPELRELFAEAMPNKKERNKLIQDAHNRYGYRLTEIADHLGIHYTTVSKVING